MCLRVREATLPTILGKVATKYSESVRKLEHSMERNCQKFSDHSKSIKVTVGKQEVFPMYSETEVQKQISIVKSSYKSIS